ncbi:hypothetical protein OH687_05180 [Burkholderia anthina]|nr:hypothetical protein OH687_05180 [Burkholderia anthina]
MRIRHSRAQIPADFPAALRYLSRPARHAAPPPARATAFVPGRRRACGHGYLPRS